MSNKEDKKIQENISIEITELDDAALDEVSGGLGLIDFGCGTNSSQCHCPPPTKIEV